MEGLLSTGPILSSSYAQIFPLGEKNKGKCIFAVIHIFVLSSEVAVDKMCVSHANKIGIYILYFTLFQNY